ncbi:Domain of unknown function (DUF1995) [Seminavis robusta]|uniref:DUF1995 domain-containing protein n=1 Tax=Seminavis robusta TaxID=568900 RepID=A0A9N8ET20_9STRA|nr:Domain of unknown function (DUF1995) [Seminavis robusta]|eukprot:Sro1603_g285320.1 Domain of unknown function (DUF1995) (363) ;mRNA; f:14737-15825
MRFSFGSSVSLLVFASAHVVSAFITGSPLLVKDSATSVSFSTTALSAKLTRLPTGISPFEKSAARSRDFQGEFRKTCQKVIQDALRDNVQTMEIEFPPLLGGDKSKTQFDDFDNVQELNQNQDWCVQLAPMLGIQPTWLIFPDLKECELAKEKWTGQRYRQAAVFTSLEEVTQHYTQGDESYSKPWGATFASGMNSLLGGNSGDAGLLGDQTALDSLNDNSPPKLHLICQPGNSGPVEDWINVETLHKGSKGVPTVVVNGALDKVRDGYYAAFIFPALAKATPFYKKFESVFYLKPISDKGVYGWVYRVYPEPWQVVLQTPSKDKNGNIKVTDTVALTSDVKPTYDQAVKALLSTSAGATVQ